MTFFAMVLGSIRFPEADRDRGAAAWRARAIAPAAYRDWPEDETLFGGEPIAPTVGALFDAGAALGGDDDPSYLEATADGDREVLAGVVTDDARVARWHLTIVTALREAAAAGGVGTAAILLPAVGGATVIALDAGASTLDLVPAQQVFADETLATIAVALDGWMAAKQRDPSLSRAAYREGEARFWLADQATAPEQAALEAARALDDAALARALADRMTLAPGLEPLAARVHDVAALRAALDAGAAMARTIAIELVGHADPSRAEPLALALLAHGSRYVVRMAVRALAGASSGAALEGLVATLLDHPTEWSSAAEALARIATPEASARLAALIEREVAFDPADVPAAERAARSERARRVVEAAGGRRDPAVLAALFARFEDPRARWLVPRLVVAIARQGGPAVDARGQELRLAMMGMGRALNHDAARRAAILGIEGEPDSGGIIRYDDLDLAGLTALIDEGFVHPQARQNDAPSIGDFFQLLTAWPELRATGYAVSPARADYRVMVDGVAAELDQLAPDRAAALRATLESLSGTASNIELEDDYAALWWT